VDAGSRGQHRRFVESEKINWSPVLIVETGQFEGDALVYRSKFSAGGTTLKLRKVTRLAGPGTLVSEEFMAMKDAPETLFVRVEAKKR
jgi:hypothetical protein